MAKQSNPYFQLLKPGILIHSLVTFTLGYILATNGSVDLNFVIALFGITLLSGSAATMNHILERNLDSKMDRTSGRPLPSKRITLLSAKIYCFFLGSVGFLVLFSFVNTITAYLGVATFILYNFVYTPLKRVHWLNTYIGAIPGAIPPICGWTAATGLLSPLVIPYFLIFYFWQMPHFFSISWMYKDSYAKAGFKMLSFADKDGSRSALHMIINTLILIAVTIIPFLTEQLSLFYLCTVMGINYYYLNSCLKFNKNKTDVVARHVLKASLLYQPILLLIIILDIVF
jgi:heme o synthase